MTSTFSDSLRKIFGFNLRAIFPGNVVAPRPKKLRILVRILAIRIAIIILKYIEKIFRYDKIKTNV